MHYPIDILFVGEQDSTTGLPHAIRKSFGSKGVSTFRLKDISEYPKRPTKIIVGAVIFSFDDRHISKNPDYQEKALHEIKTLREQFPLSPLALRSVQFDFSQNSEYSDYELWWRQKARVDFALSKDSNHHAYTAQILRNAFNRYNQIHIGSRITLHTVTREMAFEDTYIELNKEKFDLLVNMVRHPDTIRTKYEIHQSLTSPPNSIGATLQRISSTRQMFKDNGFPEIIARVSNRGYILKAFN